MSDLDRAEFMASIPPIMSGLKMGGDGARIQFDIPETDIGQAVKLVAMRGKRLKVTVEVYRDRPGASGSARESAETEPSHKVVYE